MNQQEKHYLLPEGLRQSLFAYLASKPYSEVAEGVTALANLQEAGAAQSEAQSND